VSSQNQPAYVPPACNFVDTTSFSLQQGELLPFWRDLDNTDGKLVNSCSNAPVNSIDVNSLRCDFRVYNGTKTEQSNNGLLINNQPCNISGVNYQLFRQAVSQDTFGLRE
jgi:hypothetical protein